MSKIVVRITHYPFCKYGFNWNYVEPAKLTRWERILRACGFVLILDLADFVKPPRL